MIFVITGSQKFQFNRLLKKIDELIENKIINENVYAQIGYSTYTPINYEFNDFLDKEEFSKKILNASLIITHAGTGTIIKSLKLKKKVISIARLSEFGEHVDDHQIEIIEEFNSLNLIEGLTNLDELGKAINEIKIKSYKEYISNTNSYLNDIDIFLRGLKL